MKGNPNVSFAQVAAALAFTVGAVWALTPDRDPEPAQPTAAGARWACGEYIKRVHRADVAPANLRDWRVQLPKTPADPWRVLAEYTVDHGGGATTQHRRECLLVEDGDSWIVRLQEGPRPSRVQAKRHDEDGCCKRFLRMQGDPRPTHY